jgi:hypothetical protein
LRPIEPFDRVIGGGCIWIASGLRRGDKAILQARKGTHARIREKEEAKVELRMKKVGEGMLPSFLPHTIVGFSLLPNLTLNPLESMMLDVVKIVEVVKAQTS